MLQNMETRDEHGTTVYGSIRNGIFEGEIHTKNQTYYVERTHKYGLRDQPYHSVIYSENDVHDPYAEKRESHIRGCASTGEVLQQMKDINTFSANDEFLHKSVENHDNKFSEINLRKKSSNVSRNFHNIHKRDAPRISYSATVSSIKHVCSLYIQVDTFMWDHIRRYEMSSTNIRNEIFSLVSQHIKTVNRIYENANFSGLRGFQFEVKKLQINDSRICHLRYKRNNPFCSPNLDSHELLHLYSQLNHDGFCLAYLFTYRDFSKSVLGMAWKASVSGAGGICEKYTSYPEEINGKKILKKQSLNTAVITFLNHNETVPPKVSEIVLAHEIGHSFGSDHDPVQCSPGDEFGNYIMYDTGVSITKPNNYKFSECSIQSISEVLRAIFGKKSKKNCFKTYLPPPTSKNLQEIIQIIKYMKETGRI